VYGRPQYGPPQPQYGPPPQYGQPGQYGQDPYGRDAYQDEYGEPEKRGLNGFAIASLIFGICGGWFLGLIFGIIALSQIRKRGQRGRGIAIAGVVLSSLWMVVLAVALVYAITTGANRNVNGQITTGGNVSLAELKVGDCVNGVKEDQQVTGLPAVPCGQPHEAEVFAVEELPRADFPGQQEVDLRAQERCQAAFTEYVKGVPNITSETYDQFYYAPNAQTWARGDRVVICLAVSHGTKTGSIRG
jgi:hypothetical protein